MALRPELLELVERLHHETPAEAAVSLDALGEAIGTRAVSSGEIEEIIVALEARGRRVGERTETTADRERARNGPSLGEARLKTVLSTARELAAELGRAPTRIEIAARSGLRDDEVAHALELARIMQRR